LSRSSARKASIVVDYLEPVRRPVRWAAIVALGVAVLVLTAIELFVAAIPFFAPGYTPDDAPFILGVLALFGAFLVVCSWMLVRLLRDGRAANGVTVMPLWFIRLSGVAFLAGAGLLEQEGDRSTAAVFVMVGLAMVFVGRSFRPHAPRRDWAEPVIARNRPRD
jgi:hypothetical protein